LVVGGGSLEDQTETRIGGIVIRLENDVRVAGLRDRMHRPTDIIIKAGDF